MLVQSGSIEDLITMPQEVFVNIKKLGVGYFSNKPAVICPENREPNDQSETSWRHVVE